MNYLEAEPRPNGTGGHRGIRDKTPARILDCWILGLLDSCFGSATDFQYFIFSHFELFTFHF